MKKIWIDTDTASDDAVAIIMACRHPDVEVVGISVVCGNVPLATGVENALYTVELCQKDIPVYAGVDRPLLRAPRYATAFHGPYGMGEMRCFPQGKHSAQHGVLALIEAVRAHPGEITLVTLGPLTNLALALCLAPDITMKIKFCYIMGGAANCIGNVTPAAEYNIYVDPEAAKIVFQSGIPAMMIGWENSRWNAALNEQDLLDIQALGTPYAAFMLECNRTAIVTNREDQGENGLGLPDPLVMAVALDPSLCLRHTRHFVTVETSSEVSRGMTLVDELNKTKEPPNMDVCWEIEPLRWKQTLLTALL